MNYWKVETELGHSRIFYALQYIIKKLRSYVYTIGLRYKN